VLPLRGPHGLNVTDFGLSRENVIADMAFVRGAWALVRNSPTLVNWATDRGMRVIYRQAGDDPQSSPLKIDPVEFVKARAAQAPRAFAIHLTNEVDPPSPDLHKWTKQALDYADSVGLRLVIYNYGTNKSQEDWLEGRDNLIRAARSGRHIIGAHMYSDGAHDEGGLEFLKVREQVGGFWVLTEFGFIRSIHDANKGYKGHLSVEAYSHFMERWAEFWNRHGLPVIWFSYDDWPDNDEGMRSGFGIRGQAALLGALSRLNLTYPLKELEPMADTTFPDENAAGWQSGALASIGAATNVRRAPNTNGAIIGRLTHEATAGKWLPSGVKDGAAEWYAVILADGLKGYVRADVAVFTPDPEPQPEPEPEPTPLPDPDRLYSLFLTEDEAQQTAVYHRESAGALRAAVESAGVARAALEQLAGYHDQIAAIYEAAAARVHTDERQNLGVNPN
jgi:hypothetical protein